MVITAILYSLVSPAPMNKGLNSNGGLYVIIAELSRRVSFAILPVR